MIGSQAWAVWTLFSTMPRRKKMEALQALGREIQRFVTGPMAVQISLRLRIVYPGALVYSATVARPHTAGLTGIGPSIFVVVLADGQLIIVDPWASVIGVRLFTEDESIRKEVPERHMRVDYSINSLVPEVLDEMRPDPGYDCPARSERAARQAADQAFGTIGGRVAMFLAISGCRLVTFRLLEDLPQAEIAC